MTPDRKRSVPARVLRAVAWLSTAWGVLGGLTILLAREIPGTVLTKPQLPVVLQDQLIVWELLLLAAAVGGFGSALLLLGALGQGLLGSSSARWFRGGLFAILFVLLAGYTGSWISFAGGGRFLDPEMLDFFLVSPVQFAQHAIHIDPWTSLWFPVALVIPPLVLGIGVPRFLDLVRWPGQLVAIALAVAGLLYGFSLAPGEPSVDRASVVLGGQFRPHRPVTDPSAGLVYSSSELLEISRDDRSGPMAHAVAALRDRYFDEPPVVDFDDSIVAEFRPQIPIEDWVSAVEPGKAKRWNVIVAVVESLRSDQLIAFGGDREVMPNVESLTEGGLSFLDLYTQASHSNYADLSILSSHYPLRSDYVHVYPENPTYPRVLIYDLLKSLGWHTAIVSSQNENWGRMINYLKTGNVDHFFHSETFEGSTYVPRDDTGFAGFMKGGKRSGKIDDRFTVDEAIRWIGSLPSGDPFFLYLNLQNSHLPYETPADFPRRFGPDEISFTIRFNGFPREEVQTVKDIYADSLAYTDHQLGRLIAYLQDQDLWDRTLLLVTGDTGQAFYEHGLVAHANMVFNEVMRVPLVVHVPGGEGKRDERPAQHIDVPPTILDLLGLPPHPGLQGVSLVAQDPDPDRSRYLVAQTPLAHQYAVVRGRYKLLHDVRHEKLMLADLQADPGEQVNLAAEEPEVANDLLRRLYTWRRHQLDYYSDLNRQRSVYPPVLSD
ncbi:MAG: sulfatase [Myxococcota bacterium]|nr:sulfatase [Myxococcota bacterium]